MGIPVVSEFKYLGTWISTSTKSVCDRALQSVRRFGYMLSEKTRSLPPELAAKTISSFLLGKLIY